MKRALATILFIVSSGVFGQTSVSLPENMALPNKIGAFRADPVTGKLTEMEVTKSVYEGPKGSYGSYTYFLPGPTAPITFQAGERLIFVRPLFGPPDLERVRSAPSALIERLAVKNGSRYATRQFVQLDVTPYGELIQGIGVGPKRPARAFAWVPREPLPPGEYAFVSGPFGLLSPPGALSSTNAASFRIAAAPTSQAGPSSSTPNEPTASDQTSRLKKLKELHDSGLITDADYENKKAEILKSM